MIARMWEARCAAGRTAEVIAWVRGTVVPDALEAGASTAEVFGSEDRIVLVTRWPGAPVWREPAVPPAVERAHAWDFTVLG